MPVLKYSSLLKRLFFFIVKSLSLRVMILSTVWVIISLSSIAAVSVLFYRRSSEQNLERVLRAHLYGLIATVTVSPDGDLRKSFAFNDIRYSDPTSGWYWEVTVVSPNVHGRLASPSLGSKKIFSPSDEDLPFDNKFFRSYRTKGDNNQELQVIESDVLLDDQNRIARFRCIGNMDETHEQVREFERTLWIFLWNFGIGSVLINIAIVIFSFRPLKRIRKTLNDIREGQADYVPTNLLSEITPLAQAMNIFIKSNRSIIERYRMQVGNLAHSLKTPLSVIMNEADKMHGEGAALLREQAEMMRSQINHHLRRARIVVQRDNIMCHTSVRGVFERLIRVMGKLNPDKQIQFTMDVDDIIFPGAREDLEEIIGNLVENAFQWACLKIVICCCSKKSVEETALFGIIIEDDGPGLTAEQVHEAFKRGWRLDESKPGTGLGLAIVSDMVNEYGGNLFVSRSELGGLCIEILLPQR